jgi:virginiamycin B lyase
MIYGAIGIIVAILASYVVFRNSSINMAGTNSPNSQSTAQLIANSRAASISQYQQQFCGVNVVPHSNFYVTEYKLPTSCEMPLGILVDNHLPKVWYVSTKHGLIGSYDLATHKFDKEVAIPIWSVRNLPTDNSQVWSVKQDKYGDIWFTDEKQNAIWKYNASSTTFDRYVVPESPKAFGTSYPVSIDFDSKGNVYFVGIRTPALWFGNTTQMKNGTSLGISKIPIPISGFKGIDPDLISTGSIAIDTKRNVVWITMLSFPSKGEILRYNVTSKTFHTFNMPPGLNSPVGVAVDGNGNPWVTDHATSLFFMLNASNGNTTIYATSRASPQIYGVNDVNGVPEGAYTLPYWIEKGSGNDNGSLWFNEHEGNKIARFDLSNNTLIEYWIPTQNKLWGNCPANSKTCGIANALQFSAGTNGRTWFTEWSENKIGSLTDYKHLPFEVSIAPPQQLTVKGGQTVEIKLNVSSTATTTHSQSRSNSNIVMVSSGTFTPGGGLGNSTGTFSQESFPIVDLTPTKQVSFIFTPASNLKPGQYTLMLGAQSSDVAVLKPLKINIVD